MTTRETVVGTILWPFRQARGFAANLWQWLSEGLRLEDILVPAIYETLVWLSNQVPLAFGGGDPGEMIEASTVLAIAAFLSGFVSGFLTWILVILFAGTALLGVLRFIPAVEARWPIGTIRIGDSGSLGVL